MNGTKNESSMITKVFEKPKFKRCTRGLILTYKCNLACVYCYVENKSTKVMPLEVAKRAIYDAFNEKEGLAFDEVEIDFVGAEPLTEFENLKQISEWMWGKQWPKPYLLFATTNGTLLSGEMKEWFYINKERISLGLSYDGNTDTQNQNRSGSSNAIDLDFFLKTWPTQPVKMTISEDRVRSLASDVICIHNKGFEIKANPANGMKKWHKRNLIEYGRQLLLLIDYYLENPDILRSSLLSIDLKAIFKNNERFVNKYCGAGLAYDVVDVDGKVYPCHMFSPLVQPETRMSSLSEIDFSSAEPFAYEMCSKCVLKKLCPSCYGLNYKNSGNVAERDISLCRLFKLQVLANCKYHSTLLRRKHKVTEDEYRTAAAIKEIYKNLQIMERR